jgi:hypothetical protein
MSAPDQNPYKFVTFKISSKNVGSGSKPLQIRNFQNQLQKCRLRLRIKMQVTNR